MHAARHTSRGVYTMFWTLTIVILCVMLKKYQKKENMLM